jgi:hypothetical protein
MISIRTGNSKKQLFPTRLNSIPNHLDLTGSTSQLRSIESAKRVEFGQTGWLTSLQKTSKESKPSDQIAKAE